MIKVAIVLPSLAQKGPIIVAKDIVDKLFEKISFEVFYFDDIVEVSFPCKTTRIDKKYKIEGFDIIHSHMLRPDFYNSALNLKNTKKICTLHNYIYSDLSYNYGKIIGFIYEKIWCNKIRKFDKIITLSLNMKLYYQNKINNKNIDYIYNGRPFAQKNLLANEQEQTIIDKILAFKENKILIGVFCLLSYRKGIDRIINMLSLSDQYCLLVVGDGEEMKKLKGLAKKMNVEDRIFWTGFQRNVQLFYDVIDINIMSSRSEGFPLALLEMGVNKIPVACVEDDIFKELYSSDEVSYFLPDNPDSMFNACDLLVKNKQYFSEAILSKTINDYSVEKMVESYYQLYSDISN